MDYRLLVENLPHMAWMARADGTPEYSNPQMLAYLGWTEQDVREGDWLKFVHPADREHSRRTWGEAVASGSEYRIDYRLLRAADGRYLWHEGRATPLRDASGKVAYWVGVCTEIDERKMLEARLLASEERFRSLMDLSPDIISIIGEDGALIYNSPAALAIHGYTQEEMIGRNTFDLIHPDDQPRCNAYLNQIVGNLPGPRSVQYRYRNKDSSYVWMEATAANQFDNPHLRGLIVISRDISERKIIEEELRLSEEKFARAFASSPLLMTLSDLETGRYLDVNEMFCKISGFSREEVIGRHSTELGWVSREDREELAGLIATQGRVIGKDLKLRNKRGETVWCRYFGELISTSGGPMLLSIAKDITESKAIEAALERAKGAAEAASQAKSEFLANMSHEIRTPITGIMGMAELLEETELNLVQRSYLTTILRSSETLLDLVNDILDLSKIESGTIERTFKNFSLRELIGETLANQQVLIDGKGLAVRTDIPAAIPDLLCGDPLRLKQVLLNLVGNAVKFTNQGEVAVAVDLKGREGRKLEIEFTIRDTGIGIRSELLKKIFEPFQQGDLSISKQYAGTGLGLAICTRLVGLLGGTIQVESREGVGSTFRVRVPLETAEVVAPEAPRSESPRPPLPERSILLVEDSEASRLFFLEILKRNGYRVEIATNGVEALVQWERGGLDLILLDIQMPVMDGLEVLRTIRAAEQSQGGHVQIVAITAHAMEGDRQTFLDQGFDGYLAKPTRISEFLDEVARCLQAPRLAPEPR